MFANWSRIYKYNRLENYIYTKFDSRPAVKALLDAQFSRQHVQPLAELCKTIRLQAIEILTTKATKG